MNLKILKNEWISAKDAADIMGINPDAVRKMIRKGLIRSCRIPGCRVRVSRAHAEQIAREAVSPIPVRAG
jgi:excisionase family DNA binding protein